MPDLSARDVWRRPTLDRCEGPVLAINHTQARERLARVLMVFDRLSSRSFIARASVSRACVVLALPPAHVRAVGAARSGADGVTRRDRVG